MAKSKDKKTTDKKTQSKRQQKKPESTTVQRVEVPKPEPEPPADPGPESEIENLCDECLYEFGECNGHPEFAGEGDDRVVGCPEYVNVETLPTASEMEGAAQSPAAPSDQAETKTEEDQGPPAEETESEPEEPEEPVVSKRPIPNLPDRPDIHRFENDETDYGDCPTCGGELTRTAYNRYNDAIRCTNPRCRQYRQIVKTVPTGVK